jgi:hypothetical protein
MMVYVPSTSNSTPLIIGQIFIIDPNVNEMFSITFNKPNIRALTPATNLYTIISDDGSAAYVRIIFAFEIDIFNSFSIRHKYIILVSKI